MTIDDETKAKKLMHEMETYLPIEVRASKELVQTLRKSKLEIGPERKLEIKRLRKELTDMESQSRGRS